MKEAEIRSGDWLDPDAGKVEFGDYADTWINDYVLKPRTEELYRGLLPGSAVTASLLGCFWPLSHVMRDAWLVAAEAVIRDLDWGDGIDRGESPRERRSVRDGHRSPC
jgi:hypothetical protein